LNLYEVEVGDGDIMDVSRLVLMLWTTSVRHYIDVLLNWFSPVISIQHICCPRSWWFAFKVLQWTYWERSTITWGVHTTAACFCWHFNVLVAVFYFCLIWTFIYWSLTI